jgi:hypothetical protein
MERNVTEVYDKIKGRAVNQAQSDTEPSPLRYSNTVEKSADGIETRHLELAQSDAEPRPDASAGLIEASCLLDKRADENKGKNDLIERAYRMAACFLRARAADRSMT